MKMNVPTAFAVAWTIPTRRLPRSDSAHSAQRVSAVGTAPPTRRDGGGSPGALIGEQIKKLGHEPRTEGCVGVNDVERDASCIPVKQATEPLVRNDPGGHRLDCAYHGVKSL